MNVISAVAMRVLVVLGYLVTDAGSKAVTSESVTKVALVLVGAVVASLLFYVPLGYAWGAFLLRR